MNRAIAALAVGQTVAWAGLYYVFPALLLRWEQTLGWSKAELTGAITVAVLVSALASPLAGRLIDAGRGPGMMAGCVLLGSAGLAALSAVDRLWQFYALWTVIGVALAGCLYEPCFAIVTRTRGANAKRSIIVITLAAGFASTISFPAAHGLFEVMGWRNTVICFAAFTAAIAAPLLWYGGRQLEAAYSGENPQTTPVASRNRAFLRTAVFWFLAIGFSIGALVHGAALHHLLPILNETGIADDVAVIAASFIGPMQVAGRLAVMASEKHASNHHVAIAAFLLIGLAIVLLMFAPVSPGFLVGFIVLFGGAYGTVSIIRPVMAREILGGDAFGAKSGALALPYLIGSASAPYVGALIWKAGGYDLMLGLMAGLAVVGCGLYMTAYRLSR